MTKKMKICIAAGAAVLLLVAIIVSTSHEKTPAAAGGSEKDPPAVQTGDQKEGGATSSPAGTSITDLDEVRETLRSMWFATDYDPNGSNAFTLTFFEDRIYQDYHGPESDDIPVQISYRYEIVDANHLSFYHVLTGDVITENAEFTLTHQADGKYLLVCHALPYSSGEFYMGTVAIREDGALVKHYVTSFSKDNDFFARRNEEATTRDKKAIVGDWKGTYVEWPTEDDYWYFSFDKKGNYSFRQGDRQESGTYTIEVNGDDESYTSILRLSYAEGTHNYAFWMMADGSELTMKNMDSSDATPVFNRQ